MKSNQRTRLLAIAEKLLSRQSRLNVPLFVFHDASTLPVTSPEEIEAARAVGRPIMNIHFVAPPNCGLGAMVDNVPDYVNWNRPEDAPMVDVYALESGELKVVDRRPLEQP